jgi:hypothetical protein
LCATGRDDRSAPGSRHRRRRNGRTGPAAAHRGAVANVWDVSPLEVIGSEVIPAVADL